MPDSNLTRLVAKNLVYTIKTVVGSDLFRHIYVRDQAGKEFDALEDGQASCALAVSGVLALNGLIDRPHATVATTLQKMQEAGWKPTQDPKPGDVVHWPFGKNEHEHIGFCAEEDRYVSNSEIEHRPVVHGVALSDGRMPDGYYTHDLLRA